MRDAINVFESLKASSRRVNARIMEQSISGGLEGQISPSLVAELSSRLDEHLESVLNEQVPEVGPFDSIEKLDDDDDEESYEDALDRMAEDWGDWFDDDYLWTADDAETSSAAAAERLASRKSSSEVTSKMDDYDDESVEDALARIDQDWKEWIT